MKKRLKRLKGKNKGYTLVELITVFALTALLLTAAAATLTTFLNVYTRINDTSLAWMLIDTLEQTVSGALGGAMKSRIDDSSLVCMRLNGGEHVEYRDSNGYPMELYVDPETGYLVLHYLEVKNNVGVVERSDVFWGLGAGVYDGYTIESMSIEQLEATNILRMSLTVVNLTTDRRYTSLSTIECYNLSENDIE